MAEKCTMLDFLKSPNFSNSLKSLEIFKSPKSLKSPKTLKLLKPLRLFVAIAPLVLLFGGCVGGWGWFVPYNLQPSYYEFKKMCKLNELPNDENKYNKILSYFDTDLDSLDWDKLNEKTWKIKETNARYKKGVFEYRTATGWKYKNSRIEMEIDFLSNESEISRYNTLAMLFTVVWHTRRSFLEMRGTGYDLVWDEQTLGCSDMIKYNMIPKGENNEQQTAY